MLQQVFTTVAAEAGCFMNNIEFPLSVVDELIEHSCNRFRALLNVDVKTFILK